MMYNLLVLTAEKLRSLRDELNKQYTLSKVITQTYTASGICFNTKFVCPCLTPKHLATGSFLYPVWLFQPVHWFFRRPWTVSSNCISRSHITETVPQIIIIDLSKNFHATYVNKRTNPTLRLLPKGPLHIWIYSIAKFRLYCKSLIHSYK